jgi:hypothetical protein
VVSRFVDDVELPSGEEVLDSDDVWMRIGVSSDWTT